MRFDPYLTVSEGYIPNELGQFTPAERRLAGGLDTLRAGLPSFNVKRVAGNAILLGGLGLLSFALPSIAEAYGAPGDPLCQLIQTAVSEEGINPYVVEKQIPNYPAVCDANSPQLTTPPNLDVDSVSPASGRSSGGEAMAPPNGIPTIGSTGASVENIFYGYQFHPGEDFSDPESPGYGVLGGINVLDVPVLSGADRLAFKGLMQKVFRREVDPSNPLAQAYNRGDVCLFAYQLDADGNATVHRIDSDNRAANPLGSSSLVDGEATLYYHLFGFWNDGSSALSSEYSKIPEGKRLVICDIDAALGNKTANSPSGESEAFVTGGN
ncbi:hypothetical protein KC622_03230 [Candidatus Dojkabacteria bacterium]|uniref:Uncharacterized protein n=1 Tax=Candidatus Dojkabacteria bacterium TaxID=2099670 RepID=A0A955KV52_9BACT|nr:hypothetical protein [Candidatus Dojkabacteria bacterium]